MTRAPLLRIEKLCKSFAAPVLADIDLAFGTGEIVALTGENGAGKSTLSKLIAGLISPDSGEMFLGGERFSPRSRVDAERSGVRMVLQELSLVGTLSVAENLQLGGIPHRFGFIDRAAMNVRARAQLALLGLDTLDPELPVSELGIGQQQLVEIARGLSGDVKLLILDEPTAMLTAREVEELFRQLALLRERGVTIVYISHRLDELQRIADRVVVLRDGRLACDRTMAEVSHDEIVRMMIGHDVHEDEDRPRRAAGRELLRIANFSGGLVRDASFAVHAGEILGLAGLVGSGRTELLRLIFGADQKSTGALWLAGQPAQIRNPTDAVAQGVGLLTEDRKSQGLLLGQALAMNLTIAHLRTVSRKGWIDGGDEERTTEQWMQRLRIRSKDSTQHVDELSGGNQQKVLLARWLHRDCQVLLLDEPTRGVDIGARADIYAELDALAKVGKALLVVSSDLRELMTLCDRIAVMSAGTLVRTFERGQWTEQELLAAAFSAYAQTMNMATNGAAS
jgi:ribose transport system ATP-binding protein